MKTLIVGGTFGSLPKKSSIIDKLAKYFTNSTIVNSGSYEDLTHISLTGYKLILWMPNIENIFNKFIPIKPTGSVLIISKNLYANLERNRADAVSRIFTFHANAVVAITKENNIFSFELIDALNNTWCKSSNIEDISNSILELAEWTNKAIRKPTIRKKDELDKLIELTKNVSAKCQKIQTRFFGNVSTRCSKLFPSSRTEDTFLVSKRNSNKEFLDRTDMVETFIEDVRGNLKLKFKGCNKPSVDTPIQICLYKAYPQINFFIHGHNFVKDALITSTYYPCGDLREVAPICDLLDLSIFEKPYGVINLKNHGFLIYADTIENLENTVLSIQLEEMNLKDSHR